MTQTEDTVSDHQDVGADAGATAEPDPEIAASHPEEEPEPGPAAPEVAGGEDDPAEEAAEEDQPGDRARAGHRGSPASRAGPPAPDSSPTGRVTPAPPPVTRAAVSAGVSATGARFAHCGPLGPTNSWFCMFVHSTPVHPRALAPVGVFGLLCPETSGGDAPPGDDVTPRSELVIRKTLLSALGAGTLLLGALAAGAPAADATAVGPARQARLRRLDARPPSRAASSKVLVNGKGAVPNSTTPNPGAKTPAQLKDAYKLDRHQLRRPDRRDRRRLRLPEPRARPRDVPLLLRAARLHHGQRLPDASWTRTAAPACRASTPAGRGEQALDVDAVSAICPDCKILVVQAKSASIADLGTAVNTAAKQAGVVAISNSYGGGDAVRRDVRHLLQPPGHRGHRVDR